MLSPFHTCVGNGGRNNMSAGSVSYILWPCLDSFPTRPRLENIVGHQAMSVDITNTIVWTRHFTVRHSHNIHKIVVPYLPHSNNISL